MPSAVVPSIVTDSDASIEILPAFTRPNVLASTFPPLVKDREPVVILICSTFPSASGSTLLKTPVARSAESLPSTEISWATISIEPAFPRPDVLASTCAPLVRDRESVVILICPTFPSASGSTLLKISLETPAELCPSIEIDSDASIEIFPALPRPKVLIPI